MLDPNGDGFISISSSGFSGAQDWGSESELVLKALPSLEGEPHSDLTTGSNGGHTDLVSNASNTFQSSYVGIKNVDGIDYLIVRMRIGGASTATKGYSILIDTDGEFSPGLLSSVNPGYDKEIVLETGNSGRVAVYNHSLGGTTLHNSYNLNDYHQRSVAASTINDDADYFHDFFVPFSGIGITSSQMIRITAATVTSAQSGIAGTISDFSGIDDKKYANDRTALMLAIVNTVSSVSSGNSNSTTVTGVASFVITDENDAPLAQKISGDNFRIKIKAKDGNNGGGNDFTGFSNGVTLTSSSTIHAENVSAQNFNSGVLNGSDKTVTLLGKGNGVKLIVVNPDDPSAFGETTLDIIPAEWKGQSSGDPISIKAHNQANNWTHSRVPASGASIKFASDAVQDLTLQADYTWGDVDFNGNDKHIVLGNYNLTVSSLSNRSTNVVKTTGSGKLKMTVGAGQTVTFPVANTANNFLVITNNANQDEEYSVRVLNFMMAQGTSGAEVSGARVGRVWDLHKETANASTAIDLEFRFNNGEVLDYTAASRFKMYHYTNNQWTIEKSAPTDSSATFAKFSNYTGTFSPFGVGDDIGSALPVELGVLKATCTNDQVMIEWTTHSEYNSDYFQLEVSRDGINWFTLPEKIESAHFSNTLLAYNANITNDYQYARLLQVDYDGTAVVFGPIHITCEEKAMEVYPNPCKNEGYVQLFASEKEKCNITLQNSFGRIIFQEEIELSEGNNLKQIDFSSVAGGLYTLTVSRNGKIDSRKWIIQ